jgi:flagella basal body P-ring formation protein FlgA
VEVVAAPNEAEVVIVASVVDRDDMVKEGVIVDKEKGVDAVVSEGGVEVEVDGSVMLK